MNKTYLRPLNFAEFIGQEKLIVTLRTMINGSLQRKEILDHILFYGPPGVGKTSLATIIGNELNKKVHFLQGNLLEKKSDILSVFAGVSDGDIVFIDEIHSINKNVEELIYTAMEDFKIDLIIGPEGNSKVLRMNLKPFTLIGATTKSNLLSAPLKDRFGLKAKLNLYKNEDLVKILSNSAQKMNITIDEDILFLISKYSQNVPRIANNLLKRVYDFALDNKEDKITKKTVLKTFKYLEIYKFGLNKDHLEYLKTLRDVFDSKFASIDALASILNFNKENLIYEIEPLLLNHKLIQKSPRGRCITTKGINYLLNNQFLN
ncbi:Holliday junction branch migration DNA helicase RuvB [Mycoplasmopsis columbina]|nr:Holliday junction branch migration DNA helicase RuvB [Mycoplasmopsis columbina]